MAKAADKKVCFVITPIGDNNSDIRRHIDGIIDQAIVPALGGKYDIEVAHRKYEIGSINDRVVKSVYEADLVIANLTNTNPNVMYELAIRYSFGKPAIVIAEDGTKLPFDVIDENTIFYVNDPAGANELKEKLIEFEQTINLDKQIYGPVYKVINSIPLYNEVESGENVSEKQLLQYINDKLDYLERIINFKGKNTSKEASMNLRKREIVMKFQKLTPDTPLEDDEVNEILKTLSSYDPEIVDYDDSRIIFAVSFYTYEEEARGLLLGLGQRLLAKNISTTVSYGEFI